MYVYVSDLLFKEYISQFVSKICKSIYCKNLPKHGYEYPIFICISIHLDSFAFIVIYLHKICKYSWPYVKIGSRTRIVWSWGGSPISPRGKSMTSAYTILYFISLFFVVFQLWLLISWSYVLPLNYIQSKNSITLNSKLV